MSIRIMTQVWDTDLPDSLKIVLLALADCADDSGRCWPSIETVRRKTSKKSPRTVQMAIGRLVELGHMSRREVPGRGCIYAIHPRQAGAGAVADNPRKDCTPARNAPLQSATGAPAMIAPHPRNDCTQTVKEPSITVNGGARERAAPARDQDRGVTGFDTPGVAAGADGGAAGKSTRLPADWQPPAVADLPPQARALVGQWPDGAYQAVCETFRLHWLGESGARAAKRDWGAALGKWLVNDHGKVMRDARAGVSFAPLAPARPGGKPAVQHQPVAAKAHECATAEDCHRLIAERLGTGVHGHWIAPCAILPLADGARVICPSEFVRGWVEERFGAVIRDAVADACGTNRGLIRFEVQQMKDVSHG